MDHYSYPHCPAHIFINPDVIAKAPSEYFWAGIGDALSKQCEVEFATQGKILDHTATMGLALAKTCTAPLLKYGKQGMEDCKMIQIQLQSKLLPWILSYQLDMFQT